MNVGMQLGSLEITALLGKGGMGEVYRARDTKLKAETRRRHQNPAAGVFPRSRSRRPLPAGSRNSGLTESSEYRRDLWSRGGRRPALSRHGVRSGRDLGRAHI